MDRLTTFTGFFKSRPGADGVATVTDGLSQTGKTGVRCRSISLTYDNRPVFDRFSLDFEAGACTCLLGPSGCGKSTLIRIISGAKDIAYRGEIQLVEAEKGLSVAWMSQKDLLLPWLSVLDNIMLGAKLRGEGDETTVEKAYMLLAKAGMTGDGHKYPPALSGGMRQRVALLRTLMEQRDILLMDEPFSALDALTRLRLQDLSATLTRGKTVILVTHDPLEALRLADRIVVLGGTPATIVGDIRPGGVAPRESGGPEIVKEYPRLLKTLLGGDGA
ncbi:ABC transporter ATP-binding protein [Desulforhopalus sp. IMCC35007]|uniref:ABC transporter ATP-binding protein n=1 Tax=Desulforhopalus sp. IMCC35007 TaxID=2569543 RepID=UPI0010AE4BEE|nr:ABC transporter ATP-binding protein [Desulforhopalus sp. IMCC35007]TKB06945.1 ABC transporter ATP-binding protein [Desulforhopalus sp. IMCC35007]